MWLFTLPSFHWMLVPTDLRVPSSENSTVFVSFVFTKYGLTLKVWYLAEDDDDIISIQDLHEVLSRKKTYKRDAITLSGIRQVIHDKRIQIAKDLDQPKMSVMRSCLNSMF